MSSLAERVRAIEESINDILKRPGFPIFFSISGPRTNENELLENIVKLFSVEQGEIEPIIENDVKIRYAIFAEDEPDYYGLAREVLNSQTNYNPPQVYGVSITNIVINLKFSPPRVRDNYIPKHLPQSPPKFADNDNVNFAIKSLCEHFNCDKDFLANSLNIIIQVFKKVDAAIDERQKLSNNYFLLNFRRYKKIIKEMLSILYTAGRAKIKWKNEFYVYQIARSYYEKTIYQYRALWLGGQSLDVFIPELNLGIEYQGIQHYEVVDVFGGEEELKNRQKRDNKKRKLCADNGVILLEWPYTEPVSESDFLRHITELFGADAISEKKAIYENQNDDINFDFLKSYKFNKSRIEDEGDAFEAIENKDYELLYREYISLAKEKNYNKLRQYHKIFISKDDSQEVHRFSYQYFDRGNEIEFFAKAIAESDELMKYYCTCAEHCTSVEAQEFMSALALLEEHTNHERFFKYFEITLHTISQAYLTSIRFILERLFIRSVSQDFISEIIEKYKLPYKVNPNPRVQGIGIWHIELIEGHTEAALERELKKMYRSSAKGSRRNNKKDK